MMVDKNERICIQQAPNFETLKQAFKNEDVGLMECEVDVDQLFKKGDRVAVICAVQKDPVTRMTEFTPFAVMFNGNPFELLKSGIEVLEEDQKKGLA
jgi:hypothetical protein